MGSETFFLKFSEHAMFPRRAINKGAAERTMMGEFSSFSRRFICVRGCWGWWRGGGEGEDE